MISIYTVGSLGSSKNLNATFNNLLKPLHE